jgi:hypothetical protein
LALVPSPWHQPARPWNLPGMSRDNAPSSPVEPGLIQRISGQLRSWLGAQQAGSTELPFFPPGRPLDPVAPGAGGRRFDYPTSYNTIYTPRSFEPINFESLRAIADPAVGGYDLLRLAVETRKDQIGTLKKSILPRKKADEVSRPKADERCQKLERIFERPDGETEWQQWVAQLTEEHLVIDAATILRKKNRAGETVGFELIDGALIKPLINYDGRTPNDGPAYQQILKGIVAAEFTKEEMLYAPRNRRVHKVYGMSAVEQVLVTVNIGLRRQAQQLAYFTDGTIPDAVWQVPPTWTTQQIAEFQAYWDTMVNDAATRRKMRFAPGGVTPVMTRPPEALVDQFDEWLARIIAFCFSLPPTPFVRLVNRATGETMYEEALQEGLMPLMNWIKGLIDFIITNWFGYDDLEMVWDDQRKVDPSEQEQRDIALVNEGAISLDDIRSERGMEPLGIPPFVKGIGPMGFLSVEGIKKIIANGWDVTGLPQAPMPGEEMGGMGAMGGMGGGGEIEALLQDLPPEVLEALDIAPAGMLPGIAPGAAPDPDGITNPEASHAPEEHHEMNESTDDGSNIIPFHRHPGVQMALAEGEEMARHYAAKLGSAKQPR